jgi:hypothetical protein
VAPFGNALHVSVEDRQRALRELPEVLQAQQLPCSRIESMEPTLEDSFVQLVAQDTQREEVRG